MFTTRNLLSLAVAASVVGGVVLAGSALVNAQHGTHAAHPHHVGGAAQPVPTMPGQDAFGAIQEIVRILEADPNTDWDKINLAALREHLVDMNEVTLKAVAVERRVDNGLQVDVTGTGRTLEAIKRMIPAHGQELNQLHNWRAATGAASQRRAADGDVKRARGDRAHSRARLHRPDGERIASPAASSHDGEGRAYSLNGYPRYSPEIVRAAVTTSGGV